MNFGLREHCKKAIYLDICLCMKISTICTIQQVQAVHTFLTPSTIPIGQPRSTARERTNIIDLKFVKPDQHNHSRESQSPMEDNIRLCIMSFRNIIRDHGIKSNM